MLKLGFRLSSMNRAEVILTTLDTPKDSSSFDNKSDKTWRASANRLTLADRFKVKILSGTLMMLFFCPC